MIRLYEYEDETLSKDFQDQVFSAPYGFVFDFKNDKVTISNTAYRLSSLTRLNNKNSCMCSGGNNKIDIETDISLKGIGSVKMPLGVQVSQKEGNQLEILEDGVYVRGYTPYVAPIIRLSSTKEPGNYLLGDTFNDVTLTVNVEKGSDEIKEVILYRDSEVFHTFTDIQPGSNSYTLKLDEPIKSGVSFRARCKDDAGKETASNTLIYTFNLPTYAGITDNTSVPVADILKGQVLNISTGSFTHTYKQFTNQHIWLACLKNRQITTIKDENGFDVTASFIKTVVKITLDGQEYDYTLYVFDTKTTGSNYKVTFNS